MSLAKRERKQRNLTDLYPDRHQPGTVDLILTFIQEGPPPLRTLEIDGFLTKYINASRGDGDIYSVFAVFSRKSPYTWPRTIDVKVGAEQFIRADLDEDSSGETIAEFQVRSGLKFSMPIPRGNVTWEVSNDRNLIYSPACLFRQDLYRDGFWVKSLVAIYRQPVLKHSAKH